MREPRDLPGRILHWSNQAWLVLGTLRNKTCSCRIPVEERSVLIGPKRMLRILNKNRGGAERDNRDLIDKIRRESCSVVKPNNL